MNNSSSWYNSFCDTASILLDTLLFSCGYAIDDIDDDHAVGDEGTKPMLSLSGTSTSNRHTPLNISYGYPDETRDSSSNKSTQMLQGQMIRDASLLSASTFSNTLSFALNPRLHYEDSFDIESNATTNTDLVGRGGHYGPYVSTNSPETPPNRPLPRLPLGIRTGHFASSTVKSHGYHRERSFPELIDEETIAKNRGGKGRFVRVNDRIYGSPDNPRFTLLHV